MTRKRLLDLFCGAGGAGKGYADAGFEVVGMDIVEQPNYPFEFILGDACNLNLHGRDMLKHYLVGYDAVHASPPCQSHCWSTAKQRRAGKEYPDLISKTREILQESGLPYVIENVPNAPLINPTYLEGPMFGLNVIRRRLFETDWWLPQPMYIRRKPPISQRSKIDAGKHLKKSAYCQVAGNGADGWSCRLADWSVAMGIDWMARSEIKQAIPPAYTRYIGQYLIML